MCILNNLTSPAVLHYPGHRTTDELSANRYERVNTTAMRVNTTASYVSPPRWTRARRTVGVGVCSVRGCDAPLCAPVNRRRNAPEIKRMPRGRTHSTPTARAPTGTPTGQSPTRLSTTLTRVRGSFLTSRRDSPLGNLLRYTQTPFSSRWRRRWV